MMSKRMLINYLLLVLIIIFTWIGIKHPITEEQKIRRDSITSLKPELVTDIRIETADGTIVLSKQHLNWMVKSPIQWYADNVATERLATLASLKPQSTLPANQIDLSDLGLKIPKAVVTLNDRSIFLGETNQIGNRRYLMFDSNIYLASDIHYPFISEGLDGLLDKRLLPSKLAISKLDFPSFSVSRNNNLWSSDIPSISADRVVQLINNWQQKTARITRYDPSLTPLQKITAVLEDGQQIEFFLLSISPEIIIARPDLKIEYHFSSENYYELLSLQTSKSKTDD